MKGEIFLGWIYGGWGYSQKWFNPLVGKHIIYKIIRVSSSNCRATSSTEASRHAYKVFEDEVDKSPEYIQYHPIGIAEYYGCIIKEVV